MVDYIPLSSRLIRITEPLTWRTIESFGVLLCGQKPNEQHSGRRQNYPQTAAGILETKATSHCPRPGTRRPQRMRRWSICGAAGKEKNCRRNRITKRSNMRTDSQSRERPRRGVHLPFDGPRPRQRRRETHSRDSHLDQAQLALALDSQSETGQSSQSQRAAR